MTTQRPMRLRRCELAVPGSNESMVEKAVASAADLVFLDLEDAVAPNAKVATRDKIVTALHELDWGRKTRCVRINDLTTQWAYEDIIHLMENAADKLDVIMVPKVRDARDVLWVDTLLNQIEQKLRLTRRVGLEVLIEEVEAMINVVEIAKSTPRLEAIIFGPGDYSASQGVDRKAIDAGDYPGDAWHYQRHRLVIAARAAGIDPIDGPYGNFRDPEGYRREAQRGMILGCVGKWAVHPSQIDIALETYTPNPDDVAAARRVVAAYEKAEAEGQGAVNVDGMLIDAASARRRYNLIRRADLIGM